MAVQFNDSDVPGEALGVNASRKRLITPQRVLNASVLLERWTLGKSSRADIRLAPNSVAWYFVLCGHGTWSGSGLSQSIDSAHTGLLPLAFAGAIASDTGLELLLAEIPRATELDRAITTHHPSFCAIDWRHEPLLNSKHDKRNRIYVATPKILGTLALKAEMIIYPEMTSGSNHHHEGAAHFKYVLSGEGTGYTNEAPHRLRAGDVVYHYDGERHYSHTGANERMEFIEFFVPGDFRTHWVDANRVCTWLPTGTDSRGARPSRDIEEHSSALSTNPQDV